MTPHDRLLALIDGFSKAGSMTFSAKSAAIERFIAGLSNEDIQSLLSEAGFIPENYAHDSSEEKIYAKAMDILIAESLRRVGYDVSVNVERTDRADVEARCNQGHQHSVVLDAKAFRLSRTALNPKDYKIEALNNWRRQANYAVLVGPLAGFPESESRIYVEGIRFNVTLLTFSHLQFMLAHGLPSPDALAAVFNLSAQVAAAIGVRPSASQYWAEVDQMFCAAIGAEIDHWKEARRNFFSGVLRVADKQIEQFEAEMVAVKQMPRAQLIKIVLGTLRLDKKIGVINAKKRRALALLTTIEKAES